MSWDYRLSDEAAKQLRRLPRDRQEQIAAVLEAMKEDPLRGDVLPLRSARLKGALRRRIGRYRIIFSLSPSERLIDIGAILPRSEKTYR